MLPDRPMGYVQLIVVVCRDADAALARAVLLCVELLRCCTGAVYVRCPISHLIWVIRIAWSS
jgi:hypothetical protein